MLVEEGEVDDVFRQRGKMQESRTSSRMSGLTKKSLVHCHDGKKKSGEHVWSRDQMEREKSLQCIEEHSSSCFNIV